MRPLPTLARSCCLALALFLGNALHGTVVIQESMDDAEANFQRFAFTPPGDIPFSLGASDMAEGGNPGGYLEVTYEYAETFDSGGAGGSTVQSVWNYTALSWTPTIDGAIASVSFSVDVFNPDFAFTTIGFNVVDVGGGGNIAGFTGISFAPGWNQIQANNLPASAFADRDFAGSVPLRFGFSLIGGKTFPDGTYELNRLGLDNFTVTVNVVPEPSEYAVAAALICGSLVALRRRRAAR